MFVFSAAQIAEAVSGQLIKGYPKQLFNQVSTDTRKIEKGALFIALEGENFDAHDFVQMAIDGGAEGLIVSRPVDLEGWEGVIIQVEDTLRALQQLASRNRQKFNALVVGVTGSNGKTTTKDMIASVLGEKYFTLKTEGNFNNQIGLPLTLLKLDDSYGAVVLEMGMRGLGEIALLAQIAEPDGAVITNIGETHIERLGSIENIARAKGEIFDYIPPGGFVVINGDDKKVREQAQRCHGRVIYFGTEWDVHLKAEHISTQKGKVSFLLKTSVGQIEIHLPLPGRHNVMNALAAAGIGLEAGLTLNEIKKGLERTTVTSMRQEVLESPMFTIINDTYNANPVSVKAALGVLADMAEGKRTVAILGDMYELGHREVEGHREVGAEAAALGIDVLVTVGELAGEIAIGASMEQESPEQIISFQKNDQLKEHLAQIVKKDDIILVKGSRGMKMEEITECLQGMKQ